VRRISTEPDFLRTAGPWQKIHSLQIRDQVSGPAFFALTIMAGVPATIIALTQQSSRMAPVKKRGGRQKRPLAEVLPDMLAAALARQDDFILTYETDPDTGRRSVHVLTGRFVTGCMLRKLIGQTESQRDEGSTIMTRAWPKRRPAP
jgi:hypothetical protein